MDSMDSNSTSDNSTMSDDSMSMNMTMKAYLHFTKGDTLLFDTLAPSSGGAIFGACLIFFIIAIFDRWLRSFRRGVEYRFALRSRKLMEISSTDEGSTKGLNSFGGKSPADFPNPPSNFILSHELVRGALTGLDVTLHYLLMLVVMTFNASYIISIILGAVVGEIVFGRLHQAHHLS